MVLFVTVHIHTHETFWIYCRRMCFVTFTNLPCTFLSLDETIDESLPEVFYVLADIRLFPFDERL